jgi:hypothetical protein
MKSSARAIVRDFAEAFSYGKVAYLATHSSTTCDIAYLKPCNHPCRHWPVFDFGSLLNSLGSEEVQLFTIGSAYLESSHFSLPYGECLYMYRRLSSGTSFIELLCLRSNCIEITFETFRFHPPNMGFTGWMAASFKLSFGDSASGVSVRLSKGVLEEDTEIRKMLDTTGRETGGAVVISTTLLDLPKDIVAKHLERVGTKPLSATPLVVSDEKASGIRTVHLNRKALQIHLVNLASAQLSTEASKSPHRRRAHDRYLRSGVKIRVKECKIHGGGEGMPAYSVTA